MRRDLNVRVRLSEAEMARLDEFRGRMTRAAYLRRLLQGSPPEDDPSHLDSVRILYVLAKEGKVGAAVGLERALRERTALRNEPPAYDPEELERLLEES
jgi:hypothetical protein